MKNQSCVSNDREQNLAFRITLIVLFGSLGCSMRNADYLQGGPQAGSSALTSGGTAAADGGDGGASSASGGNGDGGTPATNGGTSAANGGTSATNGGAAGTGNAGGVTADPVLPVLQCGGTICMDPTLIADMDNNDGKSCATDGRVGYAIVFNDGTGSQWPLPNGNPIATFSPLMACRGHSAVALHTKGTGFTNWGAGTGIVFSSTGWDASRYSGITFWAMSATATKLSIGIVGMETQDVTYGGTCVPSGGKQCADHFATARTLTPGWLAYSLSFAELKQGGWGVAAPSGKLDASKLLEINITFGPVTAPFDVWIDELGFTE